MNLTSRETIELLCKQYKIWPQRSSGQNFLISEDVLKTIGDAARLTPQDIVLEIGAGFGTLTTQLAQSTQRVIAVEQDKRLLRAMRKLASVYKNIFLVEGDVFKQWPLFSGQLADQHYKLIANLPYNITSLVLRNFLESRPRPSEMVVMVQKEVAERVVASPGHMSLLSVAVQLYGSPEIIQTVSRENFWPQPDVDSAILRIRSIGQDHHGYIKMLGPTKEKNFFRIVRMGFSARRKQLHNNLAAGLQLDDAAVRTLLSQCSVDPAARAQALSIEEWIKIANIIGLKDELI
jgi:16S rRNA (adenine1518-N6/adenine1519-N6)-dimethyltransferase